MNAVCIRVCVAVFIFAFGLYMRATRTPTLCSTDVAVAVAAVGVRARPKCGPMIYADLSMYRQVCARVFVFVCVHAVLCCGRPLCLGRPRSMLTLFFPMQITAYCLSSSCYIFRHRQSSP